MLAAARGELGPPDNRAEAVPNPLATAIEDLERAGLLRIVPTPGEAVPYRFEPTSSDRAAETNARFSAAFASLKTSNALPDLEPHLKHFGARSALRQQLAVLPLVIDPENGNLIGATPDSLTRGIARLRRQIGAVTLDNPNVVYAQKELREEFDAIVRLDEQGREYALFANRDDLTRAADVVLEAARPSPALLERLGKLHQAGYGLEAGRSVGNYDLRFTAPGQRPLALKNELAAGLDRRQAEAITHAAITEQRERERSNRREAMITTVIRHGERIAAANPELAYAWLNPKALANAEAEARYEAMTRGDAQLPEMRSERAIVRDGLAALDKNEARAFLDTVAHVLHNERGPDVQARDHVFIARALANGLHLTANITTPLSEAQALRLVDHIAERSPAMYRDLTRAVNEELRRERRALQWSFEDSQTGRNLKRAAARERERRQLFQDSGRGTPESRAAAVNRVPLDARLRVINQMSREALSEQQTMERNLELRERLDEAQRDENRRTGVIPTAVFTSSRDILQPRFVRERELDPLFVQRQAARERAEGAMTRLERDGAYEEARLLDDLLRDKYDTEITNEEIGAAASFEDSPKQMVYETGRLGFITNGGQYVRYDQLSAIAFPRGVSYLPDRATIELLAQAETPLNFSRQDDIVTAVSPENLDEAQRRISERQELSPEARLADIRLSAKTAVAYDLTTTLAAAHMRLEQLRRIDSNVALPREAGASSAIRRSTGPVLAVGESWAAMLATDGTNRLVFHERRYLPRDARVGDHVTIEYAPTNGAAAPQAVRRDPPALSLQEADVARARIRESISQLNTARSGDNRLTYVERPIAIEERITDAAVVERVGNVVGLEFPDGSYGYAPLETFGAPPQIGDDVDVRETGKGFVGAAWSPEGVAQDPRVSVTVVRSELTGVRDAELAALEPANFGGLSAEEQTTLRDLARDAAEREGIALTAHKAPEREQLVAATVLARTGNGIALRLPDNTATLVSTARMKQLPEVGTEIYVRDTPNGVLPFEGRRPPTAMERLPERAHDRAYERASVLALSQALGKRVDQLRPISQHGLSVAELAVLLPTNGDTFFGQTTPDGHVEYLALPTFSTRYGEHPLQRLDYESALQLADGGRIEAWQELAKAQASLPTEQRQELASMLTAGGSFAPTTAPQTRANLSRDDVGNLNQPQERSESANLVANDLRRAINTGGAVFEFRQGYVIGMSPFAGIERPVPIATISKGNDFPQQREDGVTVLGTVLERHDAGIFYGVPDGDRGVVVGFVSDTEFGGPPPSAEFGDLIHLELRGNTATILDLVSAQNREAEQTVARDHALPDPSLDRGSQQ